MDEWVPTKLADLVEIKHGFAFKEEYFFEYPPGDFLLTPGNFAIGGGFQWGKRKYYRGGPVPEDYILQPGDLLVTMTDLSKEADTLGYSAVVPETEFRLLHNQRLGKVILKSGKAELSFINWLLRTPNYRNEVLASYTGSTVKHTSPKKILAYDFLLPPIPEQRIIAGLLDALEDKIELNRWMNETLEAMARAIFKDWFVDFGPTRAKAEGHAPYLAPEIWDLFPDSLDDDDKPVGWHSANIGSLGRVVTGKTPATKKPENFDGPYPFITIPDLDGRMFVDVSARTLSEQGAQTVKSSILPDDSVMMSCIATVGRCGITTKTSITNQQINSVVCNDDVDPRYLYWVFRHLGHDIKQAGGGGSVYTNVSKSRFSSIEILVPPLQVQTAFAGSWFDRLRANTEETKTLAQLRDLLLPKLMSGEIRLGEVEKAVEAAE